MSDNFLDFQGILPDWVEQKNFQGYKINHSAEHIFNQAIEELYPGKVIRAMGPAILNGFYNDSRWELEVSEEMFGEIEQRMQEIIDAKLPFVRKDISIEEAKQLFADNPFKQEFIKEFAGDDQNLTVYFTGDPEKGEDKFVDLCKGPHVDNTSEIKAFKLLSVAGAYWRGDSNNEMLTRVYGSAFASPKELRIHLQNIEEAKKRDHRKIGKELDLFTISQYVGGGLPLYTPRGAFVRRELNNYIEELQAEGSYTQVWTPQIAKASLFKISGHYDKYKDDMFRVVSNYSDEEFYLKPMNCPQHTQIFASQLRSYKELPIRLTDFAMLYRDEKPGELSGLSRVRSFSTDDCHIFCREDQVDAEIDNMLQMTKRVMDTFDLKYRYRLSTRDPQNLDKYLGDPQKWDKVEKWAVEIMNRNNIPYFDGPGEAAFYAPKMDLMATDALGREWQLSTIQIDYVMPERFDLSYIDENGEKQRPVMLHRAILGSSERFMSIMLEHFAGKLPLWLSPEQVRIIPISDDNVDYARKIGQQLADSGISFFVDAETDRMQNKIRKAQEMKVPYMIVIGKQEQENGVLALRTRDGEQANNLSPDDLVKKLRDKIKSRSKDLSFK